MIDRWKINRYMVANNWQDRHPELYQFFTMTFIDGEGFRFWLGWIIFRILQLDVGDWGRYGSDCYEKESYWDSAIPGEGGRAWHVNGDHPDAGSSEEYGFAWDKPLETVAQVFDRMGKEESDTIYVGWEEEG